MTIMKVPRMMKVILIPTLSAKKPVPNNPIREGSKEILKNIEKTLPNNKGSMFCCIIVVKHALYIEPATPDNVVKKTKTQNAHAGNTPEIAKASPMST